MIFNEVHKPTNIAYHQGKAFCKRLDPNNRQSFREGGHEKNITLREPFEYFLACQPAGQLKTLLKLVAFYFPLRLFKKRPIPQHGTLPVQMLQLRKDLDDHQYI